MRINKTIFQFLFIALVCSVLATVTFAKDSKKEARRKAQEAKKAAQLAKREERKAAAAKTKEEALKAKQPAEPGQSWFELSKQAKKKKIKEAGKRIEDEAPELTEETSEAIKRAYQYFVKAQFKDGSWRNGQTGMHAKEVREAATALGLLAFMVEGHFPGFGEYGEVLEAAKDYLLERARKSSDGYLGHSMYEHGLATLALSELWGQTYKDTDDEDILKAVEAAVKVIVRAQDPKGSWGYVPVPRGGDSSITIMQLVALASAKQAGILVPDETIDRGVSYLKACQIKETGSFAYNAGGKKHTIPVSAACSYVLHLCGQRDTETLDTGMDFMKSLPESIFKTKNYYYYMHYYGMQAMVQDSDDSYYMWYPKVRESMLERQGADGAWLGGPGGKPQSTGMAVLTLGTPNRFLPIYQR